LDLLLLEALEEEEDEAEEVDDAEELEELPESLDDTELSESDSDPEVLSTSATDGGARSSSLFRAAPLSDSCSSDSLSTI
jgi:hypothetical protein